MSHLAGSLKQRVHLVIVGDGSERQKLAELAKSRAASIVHFVGSTEDVAPWYSLADVVAVSSTREAFGLTAIEAMASARPVVATKVGGLPEIVVQGETGLLVPSLDSMAMAKALAALIADKPRARLQGVAGRSRYQSQFATRRMVEGWAQVYERLQRDRGD
jgi:glycosyltransferase involved in cell wall biosynthesis